MIRSAQREQLDGTLQQGDRGGEANLRYGKIQYAYYFDGKSMYSYPTDMSAPVQKFVTTSQPSQIHVGCYIKSFLGRVSNYEK